MTKKSSVPSKTTKKPEMRQRRASPEDFDAIDEFAAQRERIGLEDSESGSDGEYANFDEEAILNVPDGLESGSGSESESDSKPAPRTSKKEKMASLRAKSQEKTLRGKERVNRLAQETNDSDDDILYDSLHREASDDEENAETLWGKQRKNYYAQDESAEAVEEEAQEARRLQKKKLSTLKFNDFINEEDVMKPSHTTTTSNSSTHKKTLQFDDLDEFETSSDDEQVEDSLDDMEEFLALLKDFQERLILLKSQLQPLLARARENKIPSSPGLSFLQLKYHLMLGYCSAVVFYLMLKGRGSGIQGHPVIRKMLRYRLMLEKIKPLEIKMRFQIENLLQPADNTHRYKPNPEAMETDDKASDASDNDGDVYRAPKLAPVFFPDEDKNTAAKTKRDQDRLNKASSKSKLLAELRGELDDAPEEQDIDPVRMNARITKDHRALAREAYEEENFTRFQVSKKEKRRLDEAARPLDELDDLDEFFGELEEINQQATADASDSKKHKKTKKSESIAAYLDEINPDRHAPTQTPNSKYHGSDESDIEDDLNTKSSASNRKQQKRQEKLAARSEARGPVSYRPIADLKANSARPASYTMIKNKGLTPSRTKEQRNPRVKQRTRYEKAVKKHASFRGGKLTTDTSKPYGGESTGIRTNLTKSVRFK